VVGKRTQGIWELRKNPPGQEHSETLPARRQLRDWLRNDMNLISYVFWGQEAVERMDGRKRGQEDKRRRSVECLR
jgi:hypothetical protein